jgi:hypothetical protein
MSRLHRKSCLGWTSYFLATREILIPGCSVSSTIAFLCCADQCRLLWTDVVTSTGLIRLSLPPDGQKRCGRSKILGQTRTLGKERRRFVREKVIDILLSTARRARVAVAQTSRMVTIIEGVEVMETTAYDRDGNPVETFYRVKGERYETLRQAMKAARSDREGGPTD